MSFIPDATLNWQHDAIFNQRGQRVTYRVQTRTPDYGTGEISVTNTDTVVQRALVGDVAYGESSERSFEIRTADLPVSDPLKGHIIQHDSVDWIVQTHTHNHTGYTTHIRCVRA